MHSAEIIRLKRDLWSLVDKLPSKNKRLWWKARIGKQVFTARELEWCIRGVQEALDSSPRKRHPKHAAQLNLFIEGGGGDGRAT